MNTALTAIFLLTLLALSTSVPVPPTADQPVEILPNPYAFGYELGDGLRMTQHRQESSDGNGLVHGSYGYTDPYGIYRNVEYKADANGYRTIVRSNEPGLSNTNTADAIFIVEPPPPGTFVQQQFLPGIASKAVYEP